MKTGSFLSTKNRKVRLADKSRGIAQLHGLLESLVVSSKMTTAQVADFFDHPLNGHELFERYTTWSQEHHGSFEDFALHIIGA